MVSMHTSPVALPGTGDSGGMNIAILETAVQLARRGAVVDLVTRAVGEPGSRELAEGVTLHELAAGPRGPIPKEGLAEVVDEFGEAVAALTGRLQPRYDLIHAHYWLSGLATLPVALELGLPLVQSFHTVAAMKNADADLRPEPERRVRTEMFLAGQASAIIAGSAAEATALIDLVRAPADRVWVIPPGVDIDVFRPDADVRGIREALGVASDRPLLSVVGRVQPLKDQLLAVRTLAELHARRGWAPVLVVAGDATPGSEDYAASLRHAAAELGVADSVVFAGALGRAELAGLLAASSVTLVTSRSETFGLVALESAASGTPVVAFRGTGLVESAPDGVAGVLLDTRDPREWARAVSDLLDDPERLARLGRTARDHASGLTWAASATALLGVYGSLVRPGQSAGRP
ncbi:MAG: hypothetical protein JWN36_1103 [Microbacteriaceae bacterium]|nr:hypothetical protein [Microbacteriaceae bacterium]